jgi:TolA-binding protein
MFKQFERRPSGVDVKDLHVDAKASKDKLDKEAEKNAKESVETLKNLEMQMQTLNNLVEELKSSVQMISTQNEHILQ